MHSDDSPQQHRLRSWDSQATSATLMVSAIAEACFLQLFSELVYTDSIKVTLDHCIWESSLSLTLCLLFHESGSCANLIFIRSGSSSCIPLQGLCCSLPTIPLEPSIFPTQGHPKIYTTYSSSPFYSLANVAHHAIPPNSAYVHHKYVSCAAQHAVRSCRSCYPLRNIHGRCRH